MMVRGMGHTMRHTLSICFVAAGISLITAASAWAFTRENVSPAQFCSRPRKEAAKGGLKDSNRVSHVPLMTSPERRL